MTADISRFFTNLDGSVYALKNLPEEVVAYLFARYSRSTLSLRDDLRGMIEGEDMGALIGAGAPDDLGEAFTHIQDRARAFAEKYVLGYGHSSVAEHGCVHLALEDVSIIASKLVEDSRLASYTEKSTRYVAFHPDKVFFPPSVMAVPALAADYRGTICALLDAYTSWTPDFVAQIKQRAPRGDKQTERGHDAASRATAFDILRYLLPAATHTNIGLTLNARALETLITKLLSQPLPEGRELGERIRAEAQHIVPTLLKYAQPSAYRAETPGAIDALARELLGDEGIHPGRTHPGSFLATPPAAGGETTHGSKAPAGLSETVPLSAGLMGEEQSRSVTRAATPPAAGGVPEERGRGEFSSGAVTLINTDPDADDTLVAAILYEHQSLPMPDLLARVRRMDPPTKERVLDEYLKRRGKHDAPGRALERLPCTVEMTLDYGAYRDVQRHRMATQATQPLSPALGFATPPEVERFGYAAPYQDLMARAAATYRALQEAGFAHEAAYALPLATRMRALFTWNLREVTHFVELRSARQGHPSYRRIAQDVYRAIQQAHPLIARYMRPNMNDYALTRD